MNNSSKYLNTKERQSKTIMEYSSEEVNNDKDRSISPKGNENQSMTLKENSELRKMMEIEENLHKKSPEKYIGMLSEKVRQQANKLQDLENYKSLCEKRILELCPGHSIPVSEIDLGNVPGILKGTEYQELQKLIEIKNQDLHFSKKKIEKLIMENEHLKLGFKSDQQPANINQLIEKIKKLNEDKYQLEESLRAESLVIEEQRNYIEILKQTIESKIEEINLPEIREILTPSLSDQRNQVKIDYSNSQRRLENRSERINSARIQKDYKSSTIKPFNAELEDARNMIKKLEEEKNTLLDYIEENIEKTKDISKIRKENQELSLKLSHKEKQVPEHPPNSSISDKIIASLKEKMVEMKAQNDIEKSSLQLEIEEKTKTIKMLESSNNDLISKLKQKENDSEIFKQNYEKNIKDLKINFDSERSALNLKIKDFESVKQDNEILNNETIKNAQKTNLSLSRSLTEIQSDMKFITQSRDQLLKDKQAFENEYNELIEKYTKLKHEKEHLEKANKLLSDENLSLNEYKTNKKYNNEIQITQLKNESIKMEEEMKKLRDDFDIKTSEKNDELKKLYSEITESRNDNQIMQNEILKYKEQQIKDSSEIISLKKQMGTKENNLLEYSNSILEKENKIKELFNTSEELKLNLKNKESIIQELNISKMKANENQLMTDHLHQELNNYKDKYEQIQEALSKSEETISNIEFENNEFKNKYNILKSDYVNLKSIDEEKDDLITKHNQDKEHLCMNLTKLEENYQLIKSNLEEKSHELENAKSQLSISDTEVQEAFKENDDIKRELIRILNSSLDLIHSDQYSNTFQENNRLKLGKNLKEFSISIQNISCNSKEVTELMSDIHQLIKLLIEEINSNILININYRNENAGLIEKYNDFESKLNSLLIETNLQKEREQFLKKELNFLKEDKKQLQKEKEIWSKRETLFQNEKQDIAKDKDLMMFEFDKLKDNYKNSKDIENKLNYDLQQEKDKKLSFEIACKKVEESNKLLINEKRDYESIVEKIMIQMETPKEKSLVIELISAFKNLHGCLRDKFNLAYLKGASHSYQYQKNGEYERNLNLNLNLNSSTNYDIENQIRIIDEKIVALKSKISSIEEELKFTEKRKRDEKKKAEEEFKQQQITLNDYSNIINENSELQNHLAILSEENRKLEKSLIDIRSRESNFNYSLDFGKKPERLNEKNATSVILKDLPLSNSSKKGMPLSFSYKHEEDFASNILVRNSSNFNPTLGQAKISQNSSNK